MSAPTTISMPQLLSDFLCLTDMKNQGFSCCFYKDYFAITFLFYLIHPSNMNIPKIKTATYFPSSAYPVEFSLLKKKIIMGASRNGSQGLKLKRVTNKIYFSSSWLPK